MNSNFESNTDLKELISLIKDFQTFINQKQIEVQASLLNVVQNFFFHVLERFDVNSSAIHLLLEYYGTNSKFKLPLSLILRSVNSDFLTVLYLATFFDDKQIGVKNELNIFKRDYIKFMEEFGKEELAFNLKYYPERKESIEKSHFHLNELHKDYVEFYKKMNQGFSLKSKDELRQSTPDFLFPDKNERKSPNGFVSEAYKYKRLKLIDRDKYGAQAYLVFKYYSQFQHLSTMSKNILEFNNRILDNKFLLMSIENMIIGSNLILKVVLGDGAKSDIDKFLTRLINIVN